MQTRSLVFLLRRSATAGVISCALALLLACPSKSPTNGGDGGSPFDSARTELLTAVSACVLTTAQEFLTAATELETATAALVATPGDTTRDAAREAFRHAMAAWQVAEPMQFGPAAPRSLRGGQDLRDQIYSWPLVSRCAVEEQIVAHGYESPTFGTSLVTWRGLAALEYLLFYEGEDTACLPGSPITNGSWAALGDAERATRKRAYAAAAATDVRKQAAALVDAWDPTQGNFSQTLISAGPGNTVYPTTQVALNAISDALFYIEAETKDAKLARPLGLRDCSTATCPDFLESRYAGLPKSNVAANVTGFRRLVEGCAADFSGEGLDDLIEAVGGDEVAARLRERSPPIAAALTAIEEPDLKEALAQDAPSVRAVYDALKAMTDVLKTEVSTVLDLELPTTVEGDND